MNLGDLHEFLMARGKQSAGAATVDGVEDSAEQARAGQPAHAPEPAKRGPTSAGAAPALTAAARRLGQRARGALLRWPVVSGAVALVLLVSLVGGLALTLRPAPGAAGAPPPDGALPGAQVWNHGVSSFLFGTNDSYEWADNNVETQPAIQNALRHAGFTLMRTFIADKADDATINTRVQTIERVGAHCLVVLTNIADPSFNQHVVQYLGKRCLLYEFGNESDYQGVSIDAYLKAWNETIPALRHINPAAKFIGPVTYTDQGNHGFMRAFLEGVKASGVLPDAISFHWYPCYNDSEAGCLAKASSYADVARGVQTMIRDTLGKDLPVGISEWNYDPGNPPPAYGDNPTFITQFSNTAMRAMMSAGVAFACQFDAASYSGYGRLDMFDVQTNQPKPQFTALAALIQQYRPASATPGPTATPTQAHANTAAGPLLSRGGAAFCSANNSGADGPQALVDGQYGNWGFWQLDTTKLPGWCALRVGKGPKNLLFTWYSDYSFDYLDDTSLAPQGYTLAVSADSTDGVDGNWQTVATVNDNHARAREHLLPFAGMSWVKMTITAAQPHASQPDIRIDELEAYDAAALGSQTYVFSGDSITATAYNRFAGNLPAFADLVSACFPKHAALTLDEGFGGWTSDGAARDIQSWLALNPGMRYWLVEWGTNDALNGAAPADFRASLQTVVTAIIQAHGVPILAHIPYSTQQPGLDGEIQQLNAVVDDVSAANGLLAGPDFYTLFQQHPDYLGPDGIHPSPAGAVAMNAAWYQTLRPLLAKALGAPQSTAQCAG